MMNSVNSTPSFGSTRFTRNNVNYKQALEILSEKFEIKGFVTKKTPQQISDKLRSDDQVAFCLGNGNITIVGTKNNDSYIGKILKCVIPNSVYTKDIN